MLNVGDVFVNISVELKKLANGLNKALRMSKDAGDNMEDALGDGPSKAIRDLEKQTEKSLKKMNGYFKDTSRIVSGILISQAFYRSIDAIERAASALFQFRQELENTKIAFEVLTGSMKESNRFVAAMQDFAADTPFEFEDVAKASRRFAAFGFELKSVLPLLRVIGDASALSGGGPEALEGIIRAIGQIKTKGRVQAEELMQLAERGIPAYEILAEKLKLTRQEVANIGNLNIDAGVAIQALMTGMNERFGGMMEKISESTSGTISNIKDNLKILGNDLFKPVFDGLQSELTRFRSTLDQWRQYMKEGGIGNLFQNIVPSEIQPLIKGIIVAFQSLWGSLKRLREALGPINKGIGGALLNALTSAVSAFAIFADVLSRVATVVLANKPLVEGLTYAITTLLIVSTSTSIIMKFVGAIRALFITGAVAKSVQYLTKSIAFLTAVMKKNPMIAGLSILSSALLGFAASAQNASGWLGDLMRKIADFFGLNFQEILQPADPEELGDYLSDYNGELEEALKNIGGVGDASEEAGKQAEKFIAAFDEVYQIPDKLDDVSGGIGNIDFNPPGGGPSSTPPNFPDGSLGGGNIWDDFLIGKNIKKIKLPDPPSDPPPGAVAEVFEAAMARIKNAFAGAAKPAFAFAAEMSEALKPITPAISTMVYSFTGIRPAAQGALVGLGELITNELNPIILASQTVNSFTESLKIGFQKLPNSVVPATNAINAFKEAWSKIFPENTVVPLEKASPEIQAKFLEVAKNAYKLGKDVYNYIAPSFKDIIEKMKESIKEVPAAMQPISDAAKGVEEDTRTWMQRSWDFIKSSIARTAGARVENAEAQLQASRDVAKKVEDVWETHGSKIGDFFIRGLSKVGEGQVLNGKAQIEASKVITASITDIWKNHKNEVITIVSTLGLIAATYFTGGAAPLISASGRVASGVSNAFSKIIPGIRGLFSKELPKIATSFAVIPGAADIAVSDTVKEYGKLNNETSSTVNKLIEKFKEIGPNFKNSVENISSDFKNSVKPLPPESDKIVNETKNRFSALPGLVRNAISGIPDIIKNIFEKSMNWIKNLLDAIDSTKKSASEISKPQPPGSNPKPKPPSNITGFAGGGIIGRDSIVRVGEKGRKEAIVPVDDNTAMAPFANAVADGVAKVLMPIVSSSRNNDLPPIYVGTLIGDDRSLRELERRFNIIRMKENDRGFR